MNVTTSFFRNQKLRKVHWHFLKRFTMLCCFMLNIALLSAQSTPPNANTDAECGADCWDLFSWSRVQDGSGTNIPNFGEGIAADANCNTTIGASVEYSGADSNGPDLIGVGIGANNQGTSVDNWVIGFGTPLTSPVIQLSSLETGTNVLITDCDGNEITASCIVSCGANLTYTPGTGWSGDVSYSLQLSGTYDCINIDFDVTTNDAYTFSIGTCLGAAPFPPCVDCGPTENFRYINLVNKTGSGTGATADVELNNVLVGSAEVLFSDLDINEDLAGTTFGGFDNDGGTYLLKLTFCEPIDVNQFDIQNLEVESEVSIGTTISGSGASAVLGGLALTQCSGSNRMTLNDGAPNLVITDGPGCSANPNASYTFDSETVDCLYFKYRNPEGGCSFDYVGFRIGSCVPDGADAVPVCPLTYLTYATDIVDYVENGPDFLGNDANAFQVMRDANGNFFNQNCTQIQNEVDNAIAIPTVAISACAEVVEEEECFFCDPPPPCNDCPVGSNYELISLGNAQDIDGDGLGEGSIYLDGVCYGTFDVVYSDLDVNEDVSGTQFGGFDNDGGVYILQLDFCEPLDVHQLDIRNLEVDSEVSVGTAISGTPGPGTPATLTGLDLNWCAGSTRMLPEDPPVNLVKTDGPGCGANPNASYVFGGTTTVSTLYFQYHNPAGSCSYDYVGFKLGTCYTPPAMAVPTCPFEAVRVTCDMDDVIANGINASNTDVYVIDGAGNYFNYINCSATALVDAYNNGTALQLVDIGCADMVETVEECIPAGCVVPPSCIATACPANTDFGYISLDENDTNAAGLPMGTVDLDNVKIGTYEFVFSDLDVSEDGNGTTFGGWDNDGGTMLLMLEFCDPLTIQELDILNLEVGSEVSVGTTASSMDASAVLSGLTLTTCNDPSGRMGVGPAPNEVITDGPGCAANPNGTYTINNSSVTTLYFKYHNPPSDGTFPSRCRGDYVGFRIGACAPEPVMAIPTCPLNLFELDDCPDDPSNATTSLYQDANGNWFPSTICIDPVDTLMLPVVSVSPCASMTFVEECEFCCEFTVDCPAATDLGTFDCTQLASIPAAPTTLAAVTAAPYNVVVGDMPCGDIVVMSMDDTTPDVCVTGGQVITRTITIFDDLNANGVYDAASEDPPVDCVFTYTITEDTTPPTATCTAQDLIHECDGLAGNEAAANAWNAAQIAALTACSNDICGGVTVTSDYAFSNLSNECGFTGMMTVTFTIVDDCGDNSITQTATFTIVDTTNPFACEPEDATHECNGLAGNMAAAMAWNAANMAALTACSNDVCGTVVVTNNFDFNDLSDECGLTGDMIVTYTITDDCGNFVERFATFTVEDNTASVITCPADVTLTCFESIPTPAMTPADFIALGGTIEDICTPNLDDFTVFSQDADNGGDNCPGNARIVVRTYYVLDNCGNATSCEQTFTYLESTQGPVITSVLPSCAKYCASLANPMESDITYETDCSFGATVDITGPTQIGADNCPGSIYRYTYTVTDDCGRTSLPVTRDFIIGNDGPTIECPSFNLMLECGDVNNTDYIDAHIALVTANSSCDADVTINHFPQNFNNITCNSSTVVTFTATDACGRTASCTTTINVSDNIAPEITSVYEDGICNEAVCGSDLNFWYNNWKDKVMEGLSATDACDTNVSITPQGPNSPTQNCPDEMAETVVNFVATDNCGNTSFIAYSFYVTPVDTPEPPQASSVSGLIHTEEMESVEDVELYLSGGASFFEQFITGNNGTYEFNNVPLEQNYSLVPIHNQLPMNGVSSYDLILIAQHILNTNQLDSPYKMIAADVNRSGSITTLDLVELRKMILYINTEFPNNTSWRFVDANFVFPNVENPFATVFPEVVTINGLLESMEHDFVAVKTGDVNNSAVPNSLIEADDRTYNGNLTFNVDDKLVITGETYEVSFTADDFNAIAGYQYTLEFDKELLDFVNLSVGDVVNMNANNFGLSLLEEGVITTSWSNNSPLDISADHVLFTVTFKAKRSARLSEALSFNSHYTSAEAYSLDTQTDTYGLLNVGLRFDEIEMTNAKFMLKQNEPNPFQSETIIGFVLPEASKASLTVYDVSGRQLIEITGDFDAGYNELTLQSSDLSKGVLYYQLITPSHSATQKMMLINK